jgi:hypothetical protein
MAHEHDYVCKAPATNWRNIAITRTGSPPNAKLKSFYVPIFFGAGVGATASPAWQLRYAVPFAASMCTIARQGFQPVPEGVSDA